MFSGYFPTIFGWFLNQFNLHISLIQPNIICKTLFLKQPTFLISRYICVLLWEEKVNIIVYWNLLNFGLIWRIFCVTSLNSEMFSFRDWDFKTLIYLFIYLSIIIIVASLIQKCWKREGNIICIVFCPVFSPLIWCCF